MSSSKVNFPLSPNLRLARRGSATPVECTEKKSPLRRGSWSPNLRLLRRSSDSNAVKDSQSLVRTSVFLRPSFVPFCFVTNARALSMETLLFWLCLFRLLQSQFLFLFFSFSFSFLKRNSQVTTQFSPTLQRCNSECVSCLQRVCFIFRMNFTLTKFFYCSMDESSSCTTAVTSVQIWVSISLCSMWYEISYFFQPYKRFTIYVFCLSSFMFDAEVMSELLSFSYSNVHCKFSCLGLLKPGACCVLWIQHFPLLSLMSFLLTE